MTNYQKIEASREARLWITQVMLPAVGIGAYVLAKDPELREKAKNGVEKVKNKLFPKKEDAKNES